MSFDPQAGQKRDAGGTGLPHCVQNEAAPGVYALALNALPVNAPGRALLSLMTA